MTYLQSLADGCWALGAIYTLEAGYNGASHTVGSIVSTLVQYWAVRIPVALVGVYVLDIGVEAVFWGVTISNVAAAVWLAGYFYYSTSNGLFRRVAGQTVGSAD